MDFPRGVITASLTPLQRDLSIDVPKLISHCQWLLESGSDGIALLGTTGEANSFSVSEKIQLLEQLASSTLPKELVMVGTGCTAASDTIELTKCALDLGFVNILMLPPFFYKQVNEEGLFRYFELVINTLSSDQMKVFLYHFPKMSGIDMSISLLTRLMESFPATIVGMKDSTGDFAHMNEVIGVLPNIQLFAGTERYLLDILEINGWGCISATANVTCSYAAEVYSAWQKPDSKARELQHKLVAIRSCFEGLPFTSALKQYLAHHLGDPSWAYVKPPNSQIDSNKLAGLLSELAALDFNPRTTNTRL